MRRLPRSAWWGALALSGALGAAACEPATGGELVEFELALGAAPADADGRARFVTATGWTVQLDEALVAVGPVYVQANPPALASLFSAPGDDRALPLRLLVPLAHAHPGASHYDGGEAKGEWLGQVIVDALAPSPSLRVTAPGTAGDVGSLEVHLLPPRTGLAGRERLGDDQLRASGQAEKDGVVVRFAGGLRLPAESQQRIVQGVPLEGTLDDGCVLSVEIDPAAWFDEASFDVLLDAPTDELGRHLVTEGSQVERAWFIGARSLSQGGSAPTAFRATLRTEVGR
jgi:hypothetical protein